MGDTAVKKPEKEKTKYNAWQNTLYMLKLAAKEDRTILSEIVLRTVFVTGASVAALYLPRTVIAAVENKSPISGLVVSIALLTLVIMLCNAAENLILKRYSNSFFSVRGQLILDITKCSLITDYSNTETNAYRTAHQKSLNATNNNNAGTEKCYRSLEQFSIAAAGFIVYIVLLFTGVAPLLLAMIVVTTVFDFYVNHRSNDWDAAHRDEEALYNEKLWYVNRNGAEKDYAKDLRIFGAANWLREVSANVYKLALDLEARRAKRRIQADLLLCLSSLLREGLAYGFLLYTALTEGTSAADFVLYFAAVSGFSGYVAGIMSNLEQLDRDCIAVDNVRSFLEYPTKFNYGKGEALPSGDKYEFSLENVSFRYTEDGRDILKNINLKIKAGEKLAIVGLNGAGKTTLIKLLCGFCDPSEGTVKLNGTDIRKFNRQEYYSLFSAVFQEFSILPRSVVDNISQTDEVPDREKALVCLKMADLDEKIASLPNGIDSYLVPSVYDEAVTLSGGETQRLMLARALYKNAPVIVLDEPTAALDPIAESRIYEKYSELTAGRSSVFISHRLASTRFCDRVLYMEDGLIAEEGSHEELLRRGGKYAELFEVQARYYREDPEGGEENV